MVCWIDNTWVIWRAGPSRDGPFTLPCDQAQRVLRHTLSRSLGFRRTTMLLLVSVVDARDDLSTGFLSTSQVRFRHLLCLAALPLLSPSRVRSFCFSSEKRYGLKSWPYAHLDEAFLVYDGKIYDWFKIHVCFSPDGFFFCRSFYFARMEDDFLVSRWCSWCLMDTPLSSFFFFFVELASKRCHQGSDPCLMVVIYWLVFSEGGGGEGGILEVNLLMTRWKLKLVPKNGNKRRIICYDGGILGPTMTSKMKSCCLETQNLLQCWGGNLSFSYYLHIVQSWFSSSSFQPHQCHYVTVIEEGGIIMFVLLSKA